MRRFRTILAAFAAALAACGDDGTPAPSAPPAGPSTLKVMTQNLFLGADLDLLLAPNVQLLPTVELLWASVQATDFASRARVIADAIQAGDPDVVALQEVSLWRIQSPGDHLLIPNATVVAADFLDILLRELAGRGLSYRAVGTVTNTDIELPGSSGNDYRLTDRDAIIAKSTLPIGAAGAGIFPHLATLTFPSPIGGSPVPVTIRRGWVAADLRAGGRTVHLVNTHLEAFSADVASLQVSDLLDVARPAAQPTVIVGDMNLPPGSGGYGRFLAPETRLQDAWSVLHGGDAGLTCCWTSDLRGGSLSTRVDLVFATPELRPTQAIRVNESARTPGGLSPSDHLGVLAGFDASSTTTTSASLAAALAR